MARITLKYRIAGIIFLLEAMMMAAVLSTTLTQNLEANREQSHKNEKVLLNLLSDLSRIALFTVEYDELQSYIENVNDDPHVKKVILLNADGRIVVSSDVTDIGGLRPEFVNRDQNFWRIQSIFNSTGELGQLAINFSHDNLVAANRRALDLGISIALVGMTLIAIIGTLIGHVLTRRLDHLKKAALELADGDLQVKVDLPGTDEVAIVGQAFERMARSIEKSMHELHARETDLRKAHSTLEQRIKDRTKELAIARDQALESNRTKSAFLANMSHELRTPLNAIIGYSEILTDEAEELGYDAFVPDLDKIRSAGSHLLHLISEILDLSKIEAGKVEFYIENITVESLIHDVSATITPLVNKNSNQFQVNFANDITSIRADSVKIRQALINLLGNASKFTESGTISLTVYKRDDNDGEWIYFEVTDTGIGIAENQLPKLFKEFSQADVSTTRKYGGTGLGLTISRRYCRMMGGDITVVSEVNKGSTFTIKLPVDVDVQKASEILDSDENVDPETVRMKKEPDARERRSRVANILIIDDDRHMRDLLATALNKNGFNTTPAGSGQQGLFLARHLNPDAIILDVIMPDLDGWSVLKALKADANVAHIPVVMLTVNEDQNLGYALGAEHYLRKPLNIAELEEAIKGCVRQQSQLSEKVVNAQ